MIIIFLLIKEKFMPKCIRDNPDLLIIHADHLQKAKKNNKNLKKQDILGTFTKMDYSYVKDLVKELVLITY